MLRIRVGVVSKTNEAHSQSQRIWVSLHMRWMRLVECQCIPTYAYVHIYLHTHTHTHTQTNKRTSERAVRVQLVNAPGRSIKICKT